MAEKVRAILAFRGQVDAVSTTEIIKELPRLSESERRAVRQKLLELAVQDEDVRPCNQAALEGAQVLDRMEEEDARRQQG